MTEALTITRLSLNIFFKNFYLDKVIPLINKLFLFNFIKEGYYGGITEVYKPYGKNVRRYDVNSLYPSVMHTFPMPVGNPTYFEGDILSIPTLACAPLRQQRNDVTAKAKESRWRIERRNQ